MTTYLIIMLLLILIAPFLVKQVEHNLELFLFVMGLAVAWISKSLNGHLFEEILSNSMLYFITLAVLMAGLMFYFLNRYLSVFIRKLLARIPIWVFVFLLVFTLGVLSSVITAIIASLLLVEIIHFVPIQHKDKVKISILACFSIGFGATLTPLGEPLSTIICSKLDTGFWYMFETFGWLVIPGIVIFSGIASFLAHRVHLLNKVNPGEFIQEEVELHKDETVKSIFIRSGKVFLFIIALELLGAGFKPLIEQYLIHLPGPLLYWLNSVSAILDNATLAAAEISPALEFTQIRYIIMGLIISGGMLIPGNIPNIVVASKLRVKSSEWIRVGVPIGLIMMLLYFILLILI